MDIINELEYVTGLLKNTFVGKDEIIDMMVICAIAQEHVLIVGPPGTAKSELVKRFALLCSPKDGYAENSTVPYFEYLLTRFTEPNEIFGPVDIKTFQKGAGHRRVTDGMLPRAEVVFPDEVFKANSAILNALLNVLNERVFYNGGRALNQCPCCMPLAQPMRCRKIPQWLRSLTGFWCGCGLIMWKRRALANCFKVAGNL